jgi:hypothetical protein
MFEDDGFLPHDQLVARIQWFFSQMSHQCGNVESDSERKLYQQLMQIYVETFEPIIFIKEFE